MRTLTRILCSTGSQWREINIEVMWSCFLALTTNLADAFWTWDYSMFKFSDFVLDCQCFSRMHVHPQIAHLIGPFTMNIHQCWPNKACYQCRSNGHPNTTSSTNTVLLGCTHVEYVQSTSIYLVVLGGPLWMIQVHTGRYLNTLQIYMVTLAKILKSNMICFFVWNPSKYNLILI